LDFIHTIINEITFGGYMKSTCRNTQSAQIFRSDPLASFPIAMAYVPWQSFHKLYDFHEGLSRGTIFPELDKPFCGRRGGYS